MPNNIARQVLGVDIGEQDPRPYYINVTNKQLIAYDDALGPYTRPYGIYVARVTQTGTSDPSSFVYEDTTGLGNTWQRQAPGVYNMIFDQPVAMSRVFIPGWMNYTGTRTLFLPVSDGNNVDGRISITPLGTVTATGIRVFISDDNFVAQEWSSMLGNTQVYIEVRIYP
jgi:hypothetical protein